MTKKTRTQHYSSSISYRFEQPQVGYVVSNTILSGDVEYVDEVEYGPNDPNWKAKLKRGDGVVTVMTGSAVSTSGFQQFRGHHKTVDIYTGVESIRSLIGDVQTLCDNPVAPDSLNVAEADNAAKMLFIEKALKKQRELQGLVALGELRETVNLIRHPLQSLRRYADDLIHAAKGNMAAAPRISWKKLKRVMADTWLEWAFGAAPLVSDVISGAKAAARLMTDYPPTRFVKGEAQRTTDVSDSKRNFGTGVGLACDYSVRNSSTTSVKYYGAVRTTVPGSSSWASQFGMTPSDILPAAWELIPWSFLIDYFTNAQEIVNAAAFPSSSIIWLAKGVKKETKSSVTSIRPYFSGSLSFRDLLVEDSLAASEGCEVKRSTIARVPIGDNFSFIPSLEFEIPGISSKKWLNIGALVLAKARFNGVNRL